MIADTAVTMGSPWLSDGPDSDELTTDAFDLNLDINAFEAEISRLHRQPKSETQDMYAFLNTVSRDTSVAGSECSDDLYVDMDGDEALFCGLQASLLNIIDDSGTDSNILSLDNIDLADTDWAFSRSSVDFDNQSVTSDYSSASSSCSKASTSSNTSTCSKNLQKTPSSKNATNSKGLTSSKSCKNVCPAENSQMSPQMGRKRQNSQSPDGKKWSHLSSNEQVTVVEELSQIISSEMGLREQLEVIRIINPNAKVSPTDREFVIDLETLDDSKLQKIQEYIKLHVSNCSTQDLCSECPNSSQKKSTKRQKCQDRRNQQKVIRQRQRKEYRQMMKERRSGLFVKEEVLALSVTTDPGEEDVDILM